MSDGPDLQKKVEQLSLLLEASNDGFWDWNIQTGDVTFGGKWGAMLGYELRELVPRLSTWSDLVHPDDMPRVQEILQAHLDGHTDYYQAEHRLKTKCGTWRWILDRGRVVERAADGRPLRALGAHIDVTERKEVELQREKIAKEREEVLAIVSHELKNPMQSITVSIETIERAYLLPIGRQLVPRALTGMRKAMRRMSRLVSDLLVSTKLEANRLQLDVQEVTMQPILHNVLEGLSDELAAKAIQVELLGDVESAIMTDPNRLTQITTNLVENAVKFSPAGGKISIGVHRSPRVYTIRVRDRGPGISLTDRAHIFERFWQAADTAYQGVGLGLYISRGLAAALGGDLHVVDTDGEGTTLELVLPRETDLPHGTA